MNSNDTIEQVIDPERRAALRILQRLIERIDVQIVQKRNLVNSLKASSPTDDVTQKFKQQLDSVVIQEQLRGLVEAANEVVKLFEEESEAAAKEEAAFPNGEDAESFVRRLDNVARDSG